MPRHGNNLKTDIVSPSASLVPRSLSAWEKRRAVRTAGHHALDSADLAQTLAMLGLTAHDGKASA